MDQQPYHLSSPHPEIAGLSITKMKIYIYIYLYHQEGEYAYRALTDFRDLLTLLHTANLMNKRHGQLHLKQNMESSCTVKCPFLFKLGYQSNK